MIPGRYVVELSDAPAAVATARTGARFAARDASFAVRRAAIRQSQNATRRAVADRGGAVIDAMDTVVNGLIVNIADERAAELAQLPGVLRVHAVERVKLSLDRALPLHQVTAAWATLPLGQDGAGAGMKIGIIDTGIDVNHPAFRDPLPPVAGFPKVLASTDTRYTNAKIIVARNYTTLLGGGGDPDADDHVGHGTGTSMAAAGGFAVSPYGPVTGVAPKAYLGNYKVSDDNGSSTDVIAKAVDDAVADGMDVINLSLGGYVTSYVSVDPSSLGIAALEAAARAGVIVTVSAGNDGPGASTIQNLASATDVISVGAIRNDRALGFAVTVSGASPFEALPSDGPRPATAITGTLLDASSLDPSGQVCSPLPAGAAAGMVLLVLRGNCTFETKVNNAAASGAAAVIVFNNAAGLISMGVGTATLPAVFVSEVSGADLKARVAADSALQVTLEFAGYTAFATRPDLSQFSSRGPSIGTALKPDLVAVGEELVTGAQSKYPNGELYNPSGFGIYAGTSYSAPLTAGAAAVLKAARPGLTVAQYRSLLINNAGSADAAAGTVATVQQAGAGLLNLAAAVGGTATAYPTSLNFGFGRGSVQASLDLNVTNLGTSVDTYSVTVVPSGDGPSPVVTVPGFQLDPGGSRALSLSLSASALAEGEYQGYVQIAGTANPNTLRIPYWFASQGTTPAGISILHSEQAVRALSSPSAAVVFRVVDLAGLPLNSSETPRVTVVSGGGTVRRTYRIGSVPGTYAIDIRMGNGNLQLEIALGGVTQTVVIPVS